MRLSQVFVYLDLSYPDAECATFADGGRHLFHHLGAQLRQQRIDTPDFRRICVICTERPAPGSVVNSSGALCVEVFLDPTAFRAVPTAERTAAYLALLDAGLQKSSEHHGTVPRDAIDAIVAQMRVEGWRNTWCLKSGRVPGRPPLRYRVDCSLDERRFELVFRVLDGESVVLAETVATTAPHELAFDPLLGKVSADTQRITVSDRLGRALFTVDVARLRRPSPATS